MDNSVIAKSGWLFKFCSDSSWRKHWIELYRDGYLKYYESDHSPNAEDIIFMPSDCTSIKTGLQVELPPSQRIPERHHPSCLFSVSGTGDKIWTFCGDTLDDMRAWQLALEQARLLIIRPPAPRPIHSPLSGSMFRQPLPFNPYLSSGLVYTNPALANSFFPTFESPPTYPSYLPSFPVLGSSLPQYLPSTSSGLPAVSSRPVQPIMTFPTQFPPSFSNGQSEVAGVNSTSALAPLPTWVTPYGYWCD